MKNYQVIFVVVLLAAGISLASFKFAGLARSKTPDQPKILAKAGCDP